MPQEENNRQQQTRNRPARRRPRRRRGARLSFALLYVIFIIGISVLLATLGWTWAGDMLALNKEPHEAVIVIRDGERFGDVTNRLYESGLIEHKWLFNLFATVSNSKEKLAAGTYELSTEMDYRALIGNMGARSAARSAVVVTIPEGYTLAQTFRLLEEKEVSTVEKLNETAANHDYNFSFLKELPLGSPDRLEGYLFPDTYEFYLGENPLYVINKMLVNFDAKLTEAMRSTIADKGMTVRDIVIIASMIEKETTGEDQTTISSVIENRLNSNETAGLLQIDATILYILPERRELTWADLEIDNPYNTYVYPGLPPGPIANPGLSSIRAAMYPKDTNYYYYALGKDGVHHFFRSHNDFQKFLAENAS